jgi:IS30 family transposase
MDGSEAEVGGGACAVLHRPGERRDVAGGGGSSRHLAHGGALLVGPVGRRAPAREAAAAGATALARGAGGDLPRPGAEEALTAIAEQLGRSVSTVSREVRRNSGLNGYRAACADRLAMTRTARPRWGKLAEHRVLREYVEDKLTQCWSPRQISRRLLLDHPDDPTMRVSHETIYTSLFVQTKALLRTELTTNLRSRRVRRRPQRRVNPHRDAGRIKEMTPVNARPVEALDRRQPGHWEGDLLVGRYGRSHLVTLVERLSRYLLVLPVTDATSATVTAAVAQAFRRLTDPMRKTLTWDRGTEMTRHQLSPPVPRFPACSTSQRACRDRSGRPPRRHREPGRVRMGVLPGLALGVLAGKAILASYSTAQCRLDLVMRPSTLRRDERGQPAGCRAPSLLVTPARHSTADRPLDRLRSHPLDPPQ